MVSNRLNPGQALDSNFYEHNRNLLLLPINISHRPFRGNLDGPAKAFDTMDDAPVVSTSLESVLDLHVRP